MLSSFLIRYSVSFMCERRWSNIIHKKTNREDVIWLVMSTMVPLLPLSHYCSNTPTPYTFISEYYIVRNISLQVCLVPLCPFCTCGTLKKGGGTKSSTIHQRERDSWKIGIKLAYVLSSFEIMCFIVLSRQRVRQSGLLSSASGWTIPLSSMTHS